MSPDVSPDSGSTTERKLDSWKEIAAYLGREVRTAQRWEKAEGLPIHRHQHESRGTVFAYASEIDVWLETRRSSTQTESVPVPAAAETAEPRRVGRPVLLASLAALVLTVLGVGWIVADKGAAAGPEAVVGASRLLVLPLEPLSADPIEESTGRALHEGLITGLASLAPERLSVIGRTSALRYATTGLGLAEIGDALGVEYVLEGSVHRRGDGLQVITRLTHAAAESEVWSGTFDVEASDLVQGEERVTRDVCSALAGELLGTGTRARIAAGEVPEARAAWLRGRYLWHKGTRDGFVASLPHFEEALKHDPDFVDAHVGVANAYVLLGRYGSAPAHDVFPKGRAAAQRALELDPDSAEAHAALAMVHFYYDWDFEAAARAFDTALRLGPELALTHHAYAHFLSCLGLHEEGLASVETARALEPLWPLIIVDTAWFHYRARDFVSAAAESRRALELEPDMSSAVYCLVASLERQGDLDGAWFEMRAHLDAAGLLAEIPGLETEDPAIALRDVRSWERAEIERAAGEQFVSAHALVFSLSGLDREDEMLDWLEVGVEARDRVVLLTRVHPAFDVLRDEPRFQAILAQVGFPDDPSALIDRVSKR